MIKVRGSSKTYKNKYIALNDININISSAGLYLFTGVSGSGKTTLLNCLVGIDEFDFSNEKNMIPKGQAAVVFQDFQLIEHFTVYENALFILEINKSQSIDNIDKLLKQLNLYEWKNHKAHELSGGQKQRVSIMRALLSDKPIIIADEPTGNLDSEQAKEIAQIFKEISKDKVVLIASHDLDLFNEFADEIFYIVSGHIENHNIKNNKTRKEIAAVSKENREKLSFKHIFSFATKGYRTQKAKAVILIITLTLSFLLALTALNIMSNSVYKIKEKYFKSEKLEYLELVSSGRNGEATTIDDIIINNLIEKYQWENYMKFIDIYPDKIPVNINGQAQKLDVSRIYIADKVNLKTLSFQKEIKENEVFISKSIADQIVNLGTISNVEDLLNNEILINNVLVKITNIIDNTSEAKGELLKDEEERLIRSQQSIYVNETTFIKMSHRTQRDRISITSDGISEQSERRITNYEQAFHHALLYGDFDLGNQDIILSYNDALTIIPTGNLQDLIGEQFTFTVYRYVFGKDNYLHKETITFNIKGIFTESFESIPWMFSDETYSYLSYNFGANNYKNASLNGLAVDKYSSRMLKSLYKENIIDYSYSSLDINVTNTYINSIAIIVITVCAILLFIAALVILSYINNSITNKMKEIGLLRSLNIELNQIIHIFIVEIMILLSIVFVVNIILEMLVIRLFNIMLIKQRLISFSYIYYSLAAPLVGVGILIILSTIFSIIITIKLRNKTSIELIRFV